MANCPFCAAPNIDGEFFRFECGTHYFEKNENAQHDCNERSKICYEREIAELKKALKKNRRQKMNDLQFINFSFGPAVINAMDTDIVRLSVHFSNGDCKWVEFNQRNNDLTPKFISEALRHLADNVENMT